MSDNDTVVLMGEAIAPTTRATDGHGPDCRHATIGIGRCTSLDGQDSAVIGSVVVFLYLCYDCCIFPIAVCVACVPTDVWRSV